MTKSVTLGMAGAGRACELHMEGLRRFSGVPVRLKTVMARRQDQLDEAVNRWSFEQSTKSFEDMLNDPEIDVIDICTPPYLHLEMAEKALLAGKHVICEKPLAGYFGQEGDEEPIGDKVSKRIMYERLLESMEKLREIVESSECKFMYAENFVYAPAVMKAAEIIRAKGSRILYAKGEESLKGSSSHVAGEWSKTGGGTFIRTGTHPLSAILWLKQQEALAREEDIRVESVLADMGRVTPSLSDYEHRHISAHPRDVEDLGTAILSFSDGSKANIVACDTLLGGSKNVLELYCNDAAINCTLTMSNIMSTYFLDEDCLDGVSISEMLPAKTGWNNPFLADEILRGYTDEMQDFMACIYYDAEPKSGFDLAYQTIKVLYAAYLSAEEDKRIFL
ncbi:Gfo/Idh/MocA family protein [Paraeggerthella hongkongensis]|uniref:Oxidoreductase n=1 Tax=Paraeggerthella hongkongensis TaxID=230658 RepID=A0A3N0BEZ8_9ACTN|nr:Gfo/Idh/MocA family oxidoreductase [Paraeggerthella hongkongensis]RNL45760.1 oxidoreductase [Paraeggerthella hongkongensis]